MAPGNVWATPLGLADAEAERDSEELAEADGDFDVDADADDDGLGLNETDGLGLLMISRTANVTIARSSDVAFVPPTARLPCPAVVSINVQAHCDPTSISGPAVLLAPADGGVWCPKCPAE